VSVWPVAFNVAPGTHAFVADETGHSGNLAESALSFGQNPDGSVNHRMLVVPCPDNCGVVSCHPIGGGSDSEMIQRLFVYFLTTHFTVPAPVQAFLQARGFPAGFAWAPPRTWAQAKALVKLYVALTDGVDRWRLETVNQGG
jgi:hypothetical protein